MKRLFFALMTIATTMIASCQTAPVVEVVALQDNAKPRLMAADLFAETAPEGLIASLGLQDGVPASVCAFLAKVDDKQILFDAGNGNADSQLLPALQSAGYAPADIDYVMITHMHGDHIGGMTRDGKAVFEQAKLYIPRAEYDGWIAMGEERSAQMLAMVAAYEGRVEFFNYGDRLPCKVEAMAAPGHTPGHTIYRVGQNLIAGDIMHGVALQLENPEVCARYDSDRNSAITSRKNTIQLAKDQKLRMYGMHFPAPYYLDLE